MNNFIHLFIGEINRMKKYNILTASFLAALIWIGILHFIDIKNITNVFPLLIFIDATSMSMLMIGVSMFFEKQEGVLKSLFVSPIHKTEYILAKSLANISSNIITLLLIYFYAKLFKEIDVHILGLIFSVLLIALFHSLIGFVLTFYSKDFTSMLIGMLKYVFLFTVPVILDSVHLLTGTFGDILKNILYFIPTKASMILLMAASNNVKNWELILSLIYLIGASVVLYFYIVKKFDEFAIKESGV